MVEEIKGLCEGTTDNIPFALAIGLYLVSVMMAIVSTAGIGAAIGVLLVGGARRLAG